MSQVLQKQTVQLYPVQSRFRRSAALYRGFVGGRGSGKSWVGAYDLIRRAKRGRTYLVGSPTGVLLNDTTFPTFKAIAQDLGVWGEARLSPYPTVQLRTGATVRFRTAENPEKMRGPNLSGVWLDEASLMEHDAYSIAIASLREGGETGWLSASFTPKGLLHWTYEVFGTGKPNTELFRAKTSDNPFLPADFAATIREQYGDGSTIALQELDGQFVNMEGAEWPPQYFDGPGFWFDEWPAIEEMDMRIISLDPSKGTDAKNGDFQARIKYGRDRSGVEYVEADLSHRPMTAPMTADGQQLGEGMVESCVEEIVRFKPHAFALETNQFQILLRIPFDRELARRRVEVSIAELVNTENKLMRIRRLGPPLSKRSMRFKANSRGTRLLVEQMKQFPLAEHDDGPDALEMARRIGIELFNAQQEE
jgi:hypothetical protein